MIVFDVWLFDVFLFLSLFLCLLACLYYGYWQLGPGLGPDWNWGWGWGLFGSQSYAMATGCGAMAYRAWKICISMGHHGHTAEQD